MIQKFSLETLSTEQCPVLNNFSSYSTLQDSNRDMINKILELQAHLYKVHMESQDLRQNRTQLQNQLQNKKQILNRAFSTSSRLASVSKNHKKQRKLSQPTIQIEQMLESQTIQSMQKKKSMRINFNSPNRNFTQPITGRQTNFDSLKYPPISKSFKSCQTPQTCCVTNVTNLSSPRAIGIKKNITSKHLKRMADIPTTQNEQSLDLSTFKSIQQIWNGSKKTESHIQKISAKASMKKKSYIS